MLLAVDIGNTNISLGLFKGSRLIKKGTIATKRKGYYFDLKRYLQSYKRETKKIIICSVAPKATTVFLREIRKITNIKPLMVGKDIKIPLKNRYRNPRQVGQDRLVGAFVGSHIYGTPLIIVDIGTAVTFDVVSKNREYLGGIILPGPQVCLQALYQSAALLPHVRLGKPKELIGRDTSSSILSGIVYGFSLFIDGLIIRLKKRLGPHANAKVIATGGGLKYIIPFCRQVKITDATLILKGLYLLSSFR
jgi:type III pantothenate kinase